MKPGPEQQKTRRTKGIYKVKLLTKKVFSDIKQWNLMVFRT